ncbi:MAG: hypothetical protein JWN25_3589 [Verrucomicrobiales bacterium]|nr:hypothetical protein [Verrucomicrobiales bacterium]
MKNQFPPASDWNQRKNGRSPRFGWILVFLLLGPIASPAHDASDPTHAHDPASPTNQVTTRFEADWRVMTANGWPDHEPGQFPRKGNPNTLAPQNYTFRIPSKPAFSSSHTRSEGWFFGVALNGVPFEPGTAETWNNDRSSGWRYEANTGFLDLGLDQHNAHVQPTGAYHYHATPVGLVQKLGGDSKNMLQVGWAADGFPIYTATGYSDPKDSRSPLRKMKSSYRLRHGERQVTAAGPAGKYDGRFTEDFEFVKGAGDLDEYNGRFGVTPEYPQGIYHYYLTDEFPFISRQWKGTPDASFSKGRPSGGPGGPGGNMQGAGGPPPSPLLQALDLNSDGIIDSDEIRKAPMSLKKLDKNGDGRLTSDEFRPPRLDEPVPTRKIKPFENVPANLKGKQTFAVTSSEFQNGGALPAEFTGDGAGVSPPLTWKEGPPGTKSYALIMHHLDPEGKTKYYWTLFNIPAQVTHLDRNNTSIGKPGLNSIQNTLGYAPPHSKGPGTKLYVLTIYALSDFQKLEKSGAPIAGDELLASMKNITLASSDLNVTYTR